MKDKIIKDSKKLKHPILFNFGELLGLLGLILLITTFLLKAISLIANHEILPFLQGSLPVTIAIILILISWLTYEVFGKSYK